MAISWVKREEIDKVKWNSCIHYAYNGNVFGYIWYLDFIGKSWTALIEDDYQAVMPLIFRPGLNKQEVFQPSFIRELGVFSYAPLNANRVKLFYDAIPEVYRCINLRVSEECKPADNHGFTVKEHTNHVLSLLQSYDVLANRYSPAFKNALNRSLTQKLRSSESISPEQFAAFYEKNGKGKKSQRVKDKHALLRIIYNALHRGWGFLSGITDENGELLAADFYITSHSRMLSLAPVVSKNGESSGAAAMQFDFLLRTNAGKPLLFDFNEDQSFINPAHVHAMPYPFFEIKKDLRIAGIW
ncbi:MAG: hypothetical protein EBS35_01030 [Bacteroidetes bacterium]|nr:hypothetical protein [Bacteroidota bacterium]